MAKNTLRFTTDEQLKLSQIYDGLVARAEAPEPKLSDAIYENDLDRFEVDNAAYQNNPLFNRIKQFQAARDKQLANGATPAQANELYERYIGNLKEEFMSGALKGAPDEQSAEKQNNMISSLMQGDFRGAIKHFILSIPFVGETIATGIKMIKSQFTDEKLSWSEASEQLRLDRAFEGAALNMELDQKDAGLLHWQGIQHYQDPNFIPKERMQPSVAEALQAARQSETATNGLITQDDFHRANGDVPENAPALTHSDTRRVDLVLPKR